MHPALSIVCFTVLSGAGYGLLALLGFLRAVGALGGAAASRGQGVHLALVIGAALALAALGLLSSTLHLANRRNAWRAFSMWRTSWLSREGVLALASFPAVGLWLLLEWTGAGAGPATRALALGVAALSVGIVYCTAMIYASLKTVPAWHSPIVPWAYLALSLYTGALPLALAGAVGAVPLGRPAALALVALGIVAAVGVKLAWYRHVERSGGAEVGGPLAWTTGRVRLLDAGHSAANFTTKELAYRASSKRLGRLRALAPALGALIPAVLLALAAVLGPWGEVSDPGSGSSALPATAIALAAVSALAGAVVERWLFFAEARHVVNRYQVTGA